MSAWPQLIELQRQIYLEAKSTSWPLAQLIPWIVDRRNLDAAWERVRDSEGAKAHGPDGQSVLDWQPRKEQLLRELTSWLYKGTFRPTSPRIVAVPKPSGGVRTLGILNVRDRVVHVAIKQVLEPILDPTFDAHSFGFRPGRSVPSALITATRLLSSQGGIRFSYIVKLDVASCFDTIDHAILLQQLRQVTSDQDALSLVERILKTGGTEVGWLQRRRIGILQGSGLSPLLCNFYLDPLDQGLAAFAAANSDGVRALRYADDLLILARDYRLARRALSLTRNILRQRKQRIKPSKLVILPTTAQVRWLGVDLRRRTDSTNGQIEFGYFIPTDKVERMLERIAEMTIPPSTKIDPSAFDMGRWLASINEQLKEWWNSYMYAENALAVFRKLDETAFERVAELLHSITGLRRRALIEEFQVRLPRGFQSWQIGGTRLTVLSSLAPRSPHRLSYAPAWTRRPRSPRQRVRAT